MHPRFRGASRHISPPSDTDEAGRGLHSTPDLGDIARTPAAPASCTLPLPHPLLHSPSGLMTIGKNNRQYQISDFSSSVRPYKVRIPFYSSHIDGVLRLVSTPGLVNVVFFGAVIGRPTRHDDGLIDESIQPRIETPTDTQTE